MISSNALSSAVEAMRFEVLSLDVGKKVGYWKVVDTFDLGEPDVAHALDQELKRLVDEKVIRFVNDGSSRKGAIERLGVKVAKKKAAKKPVKKAPAKKKPVAKKKVVAKKK